MLKRSGELGLLYVLLALFLSVSTATRIVLLAQAWGGIEAGLWLLLRIFATGLFFDAVTFTYIGAPLAAILLLLPRRLRESRWMGPLAYAFFLVAAYLLLFSAAAEVLFFDEFGTRFNFIAVDYLVYTTEVVRTIRESYPLPAILAGLLAASVACLLVLRRFIDASLRHGPSPPRAGALRRAAAGGCAAALPLLSFALVDVTMTEFPGNNFATELSGNGLYDFGAAFRNNELDYDRFYPARERGPILAALRERLEEPGSLFTSGDAEDVTREVHREGPEHRWNVVVVVEESLSADFLGAFGSREGLTPNLDRLAGESLLFTRMYATGTRTVRGLEAINLSVPPLPGTAVVKRPHNEDLFSWGTLMRGRGYDTKFVYAGYGYFDDMNRFFAGNGFDVVDRTDFSSGEVTFSNVWGVCDEDLFGRVIRESGRSHEAGRPFFTMVMTTSNHRPFTYPDGKIDIPSHTGRKGGVKYADYALGRFLERAAREPWFDDTLFVVVADHCAGSAGKTGLPVRKYEIPMLVFSPKHVRPGRVERVASQVDVAPTVLGMLGGRYRTRFFGKDLLAPVPPPERAFLSTYQKLGYLEGDRLVVLEPGRKVEAYSVRPSDGRMAPAVVPERLVDTALAYYQGANILYKGHIAAAGSRGR